MNNTKTFYCYNTKTKESFKCETTKQVSEMTGLEVGRVLDYCKRGNIFDEIWLLIDMDMYNCVNQLRRQLGFSNEIYDGEFHNIVKEFKTRVRNDVYNSIVTKYPTLRQSLKIYIVENYVIKHIVSTYQEVSDIMKIPVGTVKSRLNRSRKRTVSDLKELCCVKSEVYDKLILENLNKPDNER